MSLACHRNAIHWHTHPTSAPDTKSGKEEEEEEEEGTWWTSILMHTSTLCSLAMSEADLRCGPDSSLSPVQTGVFKLSATNQKLRADASTGLEDFRFLCVSGSADESPFRLITLNTLFIISL